jgi:hypothetical protein
MRIGASVEAATVLGAISYEISIGMTSPFPGIAAGAGLCTVVAR